MEEPVISFIVTKLRELLVEEARFLWGVRNQVEQLKLELNRMQSFLKTINGIKDGDAMSENWEVEVRELAYEAEDIIETFLIEIASRRRRKGGFKRLACLLNESYLVHKVGSYISTINSKITSFNASLNKYGIKIEGVGGESSSGFTSSRRDQLDWRKTYHHVKEYTVGLEEDVKMVVKKLVDDNKCRVVSIYGIGGLGKTTLARRVFHHKEVKSHFDGFAWACISQEYQRKDVLKGILSKLDPNKKKEIEEMEDDELVEQLFEVQVKKKCLVVLDDIWSMDAWYCFKDAIPVNENTARSKILITTRDEALGPQIHPQCFLHQPRYLGEEESWDLLKNKAFGSTNGIVEKSMEAEGRKMAKKCGGLPLAITVLGGLLATKPTLKGWQEVYRTIQSQRRSSKDHEEDVVLKVLALSYHDLPYKYKACFLYFSNFPEDFLIPAEKLYLLWMAEGIVSADDRLEGETMMDVAERYLAELARRCIVQVQVKKCSGKFKNCRIHDMMLELCIAKAKMQNFLTRVHLPAETDQVCCSFASNTTAAKIHKLAVHVSGDVKRVQLPDSETFRHLRSMLFFAPSSRGLELESNFKNFKLLRTLDLEGFSFGNKSVPEEIERLIRLRYLGLRRCEMRKPPTGIFKLAFLQTLDLRARFNSGCEEIVLQNMEQLRHLYIFCSHFSNRRFKLDGLTNLETLEGFDTWGCDVYDLCKLNNLRQLNAVFSTNDNQNLAAFVDYLSSDSAHRLRQTSVKMTTTGNGEELILLEQLLGCGHLYKFYLSGYLPRLPIFNFSSNSGLVNLTLHNSRLEEDPMPILERLPRLQKLSFLGDVFVGGTMICSAGGFPQLKSLWFYKLGVKYWVVEKGAMPNLSTFCIDFCEELEMIPEEIRFIPTLEEISIKTMPKAAVTRSEGDGLCVPFSRFRFGLAVGLCFVGLFLSCFHRLRCVTTVFLRHK